MRAHRRSAAAGALLVALAVTVLSGCTAPPAPPATPSATAAGACPDGVAVTTTAELSAALEASEPGQTIVLAAGRYDAPITIDRSGTADSPLTLCGPADAVLAGGSTDTGYTLHLDGASHWRLTGFSVEGGQKGVMLDGSSSNVLAGIRVSNTGDEAVHLRGGSSDNRLEGLTVRTTGLREAQFGEGVYIGTAESNWCEVSSCAPDASDRNVVTGSDIAGTTAEAIDVKEGTTGGELSANTLDGSASTAVDSLIDVKGSGWTVSGNTGGGPRDGAQVHVVLDGWGAANRFSANRFAVAADGYGVLVEGAARSAGTIVLCDNVATVDGVSNPAFVSNVACTG
ncbi:hypothetical protein NVV95_08895 [Herbiconiux sp. CPCC 205716]|uniref:Right handed beta helix domain-containing protein n=1 Tax=Herbiconiux gentiana TaxID=2970912 RepID=A0ABT2GEQ9_9MICO|nr:hypothetical protein [Herbiconiux gentiana]MCS5714668.1 hypothetical protein [Herbiconiux gentiana]